MLLYIRFSVDSEKLLIDNLIHVMALIIYADEMFLGFIIALQSCRCSDRCSDSNVLCTSSILCAE